MHPRVGGRTRAGSCKNVKVGQRHHILADEPESYGGTDRGLTPYQLVAAGLGACTAMTIRMYARRKGIALAHVSVDVTHDRVHAQDASNADTPLDRFTRRITLTGDLSADTRHRLLEIAEKCPVHKTLEGGATIVTELAPAAEAATP